MRQAERKQLMSSRDSEYGLKEQNDQEANPTAGQHDLKKGLPRRRIGLRRHQGAIRRGISRVGRLSSRWNHQPARGYDEDDDGGPRRMPLH